MQPHSPGRSARGRTHLSLLGLEQAISPHVVFHLHWRLEQASSHMTAAFQEGKLQGASSYQLSTCITFAYVPLAKVTYTQTRATVEGCKMKSAVWLNLRTNEMLIILQLKMLAHRLAKSLMLWIQIFLKSMLYLCKVCIGQV